METPIRSNNLNSNRRLDPTHTLTHPELHTHFLLLCDVSRKVFSEETTVIPPHSLFNQTLPTMSFDETNKWNEINFQIIILCKLTGCVCVCVSVCCTVCHDVAIVEGYGRKLTHNIFLKKCVKREHINEQHKNMFREALYLCVPLTL